MRLGRDSAYGVFVAAHLAAHAENASVADLVQSCGIPEEPLAMILSKLVGANIIRRESGAYEQFALSKPPEKITLLQIAEAVEGQRERELLLPCDAGSTKTRAEDETLAVPSRLAELEPRVGLDPLTLKLLSSSVAASLLAAHTIADVIDAKDGSAEVTRA